VRAIVRANLPDYHRAAGEDDQQAKLQVFAQRQHQLAGDPRSRPMSSCVRIKQLAASGSASEWRCSPTISDNDAPSARTATMDPHPGAGHMSRCCVSSATDLNSPSDANCPAHVSTGRRSTLAARFGYRAPVRRRSVRSSSSRLSAWEDRLEVSARDGVG
jgi:hypothetical protein